MSAQALAVDDIQSLREIGRQRRALVDRVEDLREDIEMVKERIARLGQQLADVESDSTLKEIAEQRERLKRWAAHLQNAEAALAKFDRDYPSDAELQRRERAALLAAELGKQKAVIDEFKETVRRRWQMLCEMKALDERAQQLFREAQAHWPHNNPKGVPGTAGLPFTLVTFWPKNAPDYTLRQAVEAWDASLLQPQDGDGE